MRAFRVHFAFEFMAGLRNTTLLMMNYLFPLGFYVLMGLVMTAVSPTFTETMVPALLIFTALVGAVLGLPSPLVEHREAGIFRTYKINGVPALAIVAIPTLATMIHALLATGIMLASAGPLFGARLPQNWLAFGLLTLITIAAFGGLGALIGVVSASTNATVLWSQLLFLPAMLLGGLMMPLSFVPPTLRPIASLLPPARAMQAFLGLAYGQDTVLDPWVSAGVLLATTPLAFGLAIYLFDWDRANRSRRGHPILGLLVLAPYLAGLFLG